MAVSSALQWHYEHTEYRVRLAHGGHICISLHQALPKPLQILLPATTADWAFVSAWNPHSRRLSRADNRQRQRDLLHALRDLPGTRRIYPGIGVGQLDSRSRRWCEPSLFVPALDQTALTQLLHRFGQHAAVRGTGAAPAELYFPGPA